MINRGTLGYFFVLSSVELTIAQSHAAALHVFQTARLHVAIRSEHTQLACVFLDCSMDRVGKVKPNSFMFVKYIITVLPITMGPVMALQNVALFPKM
jgi:hypothetical protein